MEISEVIAEIRKSGCPFGLSRKNFVAVGISKHEMEMVRKSKICVEVDGYWYMVESDDTTVVI